MPVPRSPLSQLDLIVSRPRRFYRERKFKPTLFRDPQHCPEEGLGGAAYWVTYHSMDNIGICVSTWDADAGVHWRAHVDGHILATRGPDGTKTRIAFATLPDAINALLAHRGVQPDYDPGPAQVMTRA